MTALAETYSTTIADPTITAGLLVTRGPNRGTWFPLDRPVLTIGRHLDSDIFLDDSTVGRRHAEFHCDNGVFSVTDVGSLNGTYVNRSPVDSATVTDGDEIWIGKFRLVLLSALSTRSTEHSP